MAAPERLSHADVEGLRVGRFGGKINTTCILWRIGDTLIDTGPPSEWRRVLRFAAERPVRRVVVTHHHEDHAGNLARLAAEAAGPDGRTVEILAPRESLEPLAEGFPLQLYRRVIWGRPARVRAAPLPRAVELAAGGELLPVLLPGHSPDMTCFVEPRRRVLLSADLYVARHQRYLRADESLGGILDSLRRALHLDFDTLLCAHRGVVKDGKARLRQKLEYFEQLCGRAAQLAAGGLEVAGITRRLLGPEDSVSRISLMHYSKRNLIRGCLEAAGGAGRGPETSRRHAGPPGP
jgi:glyoxylase-like metal-dependent hydrolase (beta-lactamase superfamily II)